MVGKLQYQDNGYEKKKYGFKDPMYNVTSNIFFLLLLSKVDKTRFLIITKNEFLVKNQKSIPI